MKATMSNKNAGKLAMASGKMGVKEATAKMATSAGTAKANKNAPKMKPSSTPKAKAKGGKKMK
jgi:hypothetical protein